MGKLTLKNIQDMLPENGPERIVVNSNLRNVRNQLTPPRVAHHFNYTSVSSWI